MFYATRADLDRLFEGLKHQGYRLIGPKLVDDAICYDEIHTTDDLPKGFTDDQAPGRYRIRRRDDDALFGYVVGPHSWKRFLHPPKVRLLNLKRTKQGWKDQTESPSSEKFAFIGVRACELAAIRIQDKVLLDGPFQDPIYRAKRQDNFFVAVNCVQPAATCFCTSMETGPEATQGADVVITEWVQDKKIHYAIDAASKKGEKFLKALRLRTTPAQAESLREKVKELMHKARTLMTQRINRSRLKEVMERSWDSPHWAKIAERCLSCANCTMVCPTCFCTDVEDVTDLTGVYAQRWRHWDSCFNLEFTYMHGGSVRHSGASRYRQWMTHKLSSWQDQFGEVGCVGCGRCISWCPVGIDITQEFFIFEKDVGESDPETSE